MSDFPVKFMEDQSFDVEFNGDASFMVEFGGGSGPPPYIGPYVVTPGEEAQRLATEGLAASRDIVVEAIPSNYGLISWSGAGIRVS